MDRIAVIRKSLAAFVCGILGFLPLIGLVFGTAAVFHWIRLRRYPHWNPAARYLEVGVVLGFVGIFLSILAVVLIAVAVADSF